MKLLPILLLALATNALLQESDTPSPEKAAQDATAQAQAKVEEALKLAQDKVDQAAEEAAAQQELVQDKLQEAAVEARIPEPLDVENLDPKQFMADPLVTTSVQEANAAAEGAAGAGREVILAAPILDLPENGNESLAASFDETEDEGLELPGTSHAPIGVPLALQVPTGRFGMVLRGSQNRFDGLRDSRDDLSSAQAFGRGYTLAPTKRTDQLVELEAYYGLNERWDLYAVVPYAAHDLDYDRSLGGSASVDSSGMGDLEIGGIFRSYDVDGTRVSYLAGVSLPTGSVDERGDYAGVGDAKLPYDLQLGSGTLDLLPGILLETEVGKVQVGARAAGRVHLETENDEGWFRSNSMRVDLWAGMALAENLDGSLRVQGDWWGDLHGRDADLDPTQSPGEDTLRQGGDRINLYGGLSYDLAEAKTNRLQLEVGAPVEEWLDGPGLSQQLSLLLGWRVNF